MNTKLSMQMKLNGAVIQDMINNLLSLGQVITVARLRMQIISTSNQ